MKQYTKKELWQGFFTVLKNQLTALLLALGAFYALGAGWTEYNAPDGQEDILVMQIRPNAEGSAYALLEKHKNCYPFDIKKRFEKAVLIGTIMRWNPNDAYFYTEDWDLTVKAVEQAVQGIDRNIDGVAAFCYRFEKGLAEDAPYSINI